MYVFFNMHGGLRQLSGLRFGQEESFCEKMTSMLMMQKWNKLAAKALETHKEYRVFSKERLCPTALTANCTRKYEQWSGNTLLDLTPIGTNQDLSASWMDCSAVWCSLRLMRSSNKDNLRRLQPTKSLVPWQTNGFSFSNRLIINNFTFHILVPRLKLCGI